MSERNSADEEFESHNYATTNDTPSSGDDENQGGRFGSIDRRQYLKLGAATAAGAVAFSGRSTAETRDGVSFDRVVNAVDDLGMDPNGNEAIDSELDSAWGSGTLIEFPPGEYLVTEEHGYYNDDNVGMVGTTGDRSDVEFVFPTGYEQRFLNVRFGSDWLFGDFTIQQSDDWETGVGCSFAPDGDATIKNIEVAGNNPRNTYRSLALNVYSSDGELTLDGYVRTGASDVGDYPSGTQALLIDPSNEGTIYIRDAHIENAGENGIYGSRSSGEVRIEDSYFANNDIASVRIAGDGSYVKDSTFVVDIDDADNRGDFDNPRALWIESGPHGYTGSSVENCDFILKSADHCDGLVRIQPTAGDVDIENCRFQNETRFPTVFAEEPDDISGSGPVTVRNCSITGGAANPRRAAIELIGRDGSLVSDCCISMDGEQNGVTVRNASNCTVRRSTIDVNGTALYTPGSSVGTGSLSYSGSCPLPSDDGAGAGGDVGGSRGDSEETSDSESGDDGSESSDDGSDGGDDSDDAEAQTADTSGGTRRLVLTGDGFAPYEFSVSGDLEFDSRFGTEDSIDGSTASGFLVGGTDGYEFTGDITSFDVEGSATVRLDGETVDPSSLGDGSSGGDSDSESSESESDDSSSSDGGSSGGMHALTLSGDGLAPYEFSVSGDVGFDPTFGTEDRIDGSTVTGFLVGGTDKYQFDGDITSFDVEGSATVRLDGETVDPSSLGDGSSGGSSGDDSDSESEESDSESSDSDDSSGADGTLGNVLMLNSDDFAPYDIEVSGDIAFDPNYGTEDSLGDGSASGFLVGGTDVYRFSGDITGFEYEGSVDAQLNGESVDPSSLGN
ncbi:right-handed parallel beta-helix repeat-containing protein [Halomarina salina]|uniref:Right-handed parallel beta-helix repeat-containing protein n=1 Tax=Halomarina salina TaxID=1872699 RepID=A0ABD5RNM6_9EURY|nr:right-handed parallel beta-helix repeat-containing protein [Halomarina salina]